MRRPTHGATSTLPTFPGEFAVFAEEGQVCGQECLRGLIRHAHARNFPEFWENVIFIVIFRISIMFYRIACALSILTVDQVPRISLPGQRGVRSNFTAKEF